MPTIQEFVAYPPLVDPIWWLADPKRRADLSPEELERIHEKDRATYRRMRERMAVDPEYREARLQVARRGTRRYRERTKGLDDLKLKRRESDRASRARRAASIGERRRAAYAGERAEAIRARNRDWYRRNRERRLASQKEYRRLNAEALRAREREKQRLEYAADPKKFNDYMKGWRAKNRTRARQYVRISSYKRRGAPGDFTVGQWLALVRVYDSRCGYCGRVRPLEADHRLPIIRGGSNTIDNIIPACRACNRRKHDKTEAEFRAMLALEKPARDSCPEMALLPALVGSVPAG